jgi:hypothetical protein
MEQKLNTMNFQEFLNSKDACQSAQEWAKGMTIEQAIEQCHRGDWLLWLAQRLEVDKRLLVGAAGHCVNTVRHLMTDERSRNCVDVCIKYGSGEATNDELAKARAGARAAAANAAARGEYWAAIAARAAARARAASDAAAEAAATAAAGASADAADAAAARDAAKTKNQMETADIFRQHLKEAMVEKWNHTMDGGILGE